MIFCLRMHLYILLDTATPHLFNLLDCGKVNAVFVINIAVGIVHSHHLGPVLGSLFAGIDGHIAGAGNHHRFAFKGVAVVTQHGIRKIAQTIAGGLRPGQRTTVRNALAGKHTGKLVAQPLVLAVQIPNLPAAHADIPGRDVGICADVLGKLRHEALAEAHYLSV